MELNWLNEKGISVEEGLGYTGGEDKYIAAMQRFFRAYEQNKKCVEELLEEGNIKDYGIKVHALKSNSRMIGAGKLGEAFEELELAAGKEDVALIREKTPAALAQYAEVVEILRPFGEMESVKVSGEIDGAEAKEVAGKLLEALDDFDDELSAELASKLFGYPFRPTQKGKLREAMEYISDFMYDEAADLINQIIPAIE